METQEEKIIELLKSDKLMATVSCQSTQKRMWYDTSNKGWFVGTFKGKNLKFHDTLEEALTSLTTES